MIRVTDPDTYDTGKTCLGGGMHCTVPVLLVLICGVITGKVTNRHRPTMLTVQLFTELSDSRKKLVENNLQNSREFPAALAFLSGWPLLTLLHCSFISADAATTPWCAKVPRWEFRIDSHCSPLSVTAPLYIRSWPNVPTIFRSFESVIGATNEAT